MRYAVFSPSTSTRASSTNATPSVRVTDIDPGREDVISEVETLEDGSLKREILSAGKHYYDSGMYEEHHRGVKWRKPTNDIGVLLRDKSCKNVDDEQLSSCLSVLKMPQV